MLQIENSIPRLILVHSLIRNKLEIQKMAREINIRLIEILEDKHIYNYMFIAGLKLSINFGVLRLPESIRME